MTITSQRCEILRLYRRSQTIECADNADYVEDPANEWHYDPINLFTGTNKSSQCVLGENTKACPAQIQLSFFNAYNLIVTLIVIVLIYILINSASKRKKPVKKRKVRKK